MDFLFRRGLFLMLIFFFFGSIVMFAGFQFFIFYGLGFVEEVCACLFIIYSLLRLFLLKIKSNGFFFIYYFTQVKKPAIASFTQGLPTQQFFFFLVKNVIVRFYFLWQTIRPLCSMNWIQRKSTFVFWIYEKQVSTQQFWVVNVFLRPNGP